MKRSEQLITIANAEIEILMKYTEARRFVFETKDGYINGFHIEQNKMGHRRITELDQFVYRALRKLRSAVNRATEHENYDTLKELQAAIYYGDISYTKDRMMARIVKDAFETTILIEEESGKYVYDYIEDGWLGEELDK